MSGQNEVNWAEIVAAKVFYKSIRAPGKRVSPEVTVRRLGKIIQGFFCCSIRSQYSQGRLEMVWRVSFPRGSYTFIENFRRYDFCSVYFVLPGLTAPGSPRMPFDSTDREKCFIKY